MSDTVQYVLEVGDVAYTVSNVTFGPTTFAVPPGDVGSFVSFFSSDNTDLLANVDAFTISEYVGGQKVGLLTASGVIASYSFGLGHQTTGAEVYAFDTVNLDLTVTGEFDQQTPCFLRGTQIATPHGAVYVEDLSPGMVVLLKGDEKATVVWVGRRRSMSPTIVRFLPGSLGHGPTSDLLVSEDHGIYLCGSLVPAGLLVNGDTITIDRPELAILYHIELESHGILIANGAYAESYLDTGNRRQFGNCPLEYDPSIASAPLGPCVEMVLASPRLDLIKDRLRAGLLSPISLS